MLSILIDLRGVELSEHFLHLLDLSMGLPDAVDFYEVHWWLLGAELSDLAGLSSAGKCANDDCFRVRMCHEFSFKIFN